jgi:NAD(P)-dependent dehydrogenase (short-subunit alcohol dehydrogenase family)
MTGLLDNKVVVISGVGPALGTTLARRCAEAGADLVLAARTVERLDDVAKQITDTGRRAVAVGTDITDEEQVNNLVEASLAAFGRVDVLINNAGMSPLYESLSSVTEKLFDAVVNLNLKGPFRLSTLVGERMVADGGGSIINVSSSGSRRPRPEQLPYSAAKAGLNALTEGLALAFGPTVRVNTLMPGPFLTDISKAWDIPATTKGAQHFALQRLGQPPEIIGAALYLASDASSYTSGSVIRVDGGIP